MYLDYRFHFQPCGTGDYDFSASFLGFILSTKNDRGIDLSGHGIGLSYEWYIGVNFQCVVLRFDL